MAKANNNGLKGQPGRIPWYKLNGLEYRILVRTTAEGALYNNLIGHIQFFSKLKNGTPTQPYQMPSLHLKRPNTHTGIACCSEYRTLSKQRILKKGWQFFINLV